MSKDQLPPIQFKALADELLRDAVELLKRWLPNGVLVAGKEWTVGSVDGEAGSSLSINVKNGRWKDFQTGEAGGDLISLYAAIHRMPVGKAAAELARDERLEDVAGIVTPPPGGAPPPPPRPPKPPAPPPGPASEPEGWKSVMPVPPTAQRATFKHGYRKREDIVHTAEYRLDGHLLGYVVRFRTSDGGKETLPYTWCVSERDGGAMWKWKMWDFPRPLFLPGGLKPGTRTVVLVEGEKKAEALHALLEAGSPGVYCVASWPGGCKSWTKALWQWLEGATVLAWPDCDAKREPLTKAERDACGDDVALEVAKASKPLLPPEKQPGTQAMLGIGALLRDTFKCTVSMLPIPAPGEVADGWDCGDAIEADGWDHARVLEFFGRATRLVTAAPAAAEVPGADAPDEPKPKGKKGEGERKERPDLPWWLAMFVNPHTGLVQMSRKTVITALRQDEELQGCLGYNELTGEVSTVKAWPWREKPGPMLDTDDLRLGDWISVKYKVPGAGRAGLTEAIHTVADENPYHPVKRYLEALVHDGRPRSRKWLMYACQIDPASLTPQRREYLELVSEFWLIGMVARVFEPGCKYDYSLVLEGLTGRRKSTFLQAMAGKEYYSDTHFDIGGNKDGFDQLQGLWVYELSEMSALRRADSESVKAFFSSQSDRYRSSYGRYVQNHPRQCVIGCTTNKRQYLYDTTGNRRFWPLWIDQPILIEWFLKYRDQLFAEAVALYKAGARYAPTLDEEQRLFVPEQELRLVETGVQSELMRLLTRPGAAGEKGAEGASTAITMNTNFVTIGQLVRALGTDVGKSTTMLESQIRSWLEAQGWNYGRLGAKNEAGLRPWGYKRPKDWPPAIPDEENTDPGPDGQGGDNSGQAQAVQAQDDDDLPI